MGKYASQAQRRYFNAVAGKPGSGITKAEANKRNKASKGAKLPARAKAKKKPRKR